ncbi:MAG: PKD domain-containing protein, partial [Lachnospiraceae bacterium]|nr:PKD domain-containing protein [Lachnospiraceae bacterium]
MKSTKKIIAIILAITMLPFSDFAGTMPVAAETVTTDLADKNTAETNINIEPVLENINLKAELNNYGVTELSFNRSEDASEYKIYRNDEPLVSLVNGESSYSDADIEGENEYEYRVEAFDDKGNLRYTSNEAFIETPAIVTDGIYLTEDTVVFSVNIDNEGGYIDLNGYNLLVYRDVYTDNEVHFNGGSLMCMGDFTIIDSFIMDYESDYLYVGGDLYINSDRFWHQMNNGTVEVKGDFKAGTLAAYSFYNKFIFSGDKKQDIYFYEKENEDDYISSGSENREFTFENVELLNKSKEGVHFEEGFSFNNLITNGNVVYSGEDLIGTAGENGREGYTLTSDEEIEGDFILSEGELNLNGHTLAVNGDLINVAGLININGGRLIIKGDYRGQSVIGNGENTTYGKSTGIIQMYYESDYVCVYGDYYDNSMENNSFSAGTLEIKGDISLNSLCKCTYFNSGSEHTIVLSGETKQNIIINSSDDTEHYEFNNLDITNKQGVKIEGNLVVKGSIKTNGNPVEGYIGICNSTALEDDSYDYDIKIFDTLSLKNDLVINGNIYVIETGTIEFNGYTVSVKDFICHSYYLGAGTLNVSGDIEVWEYFNAGSSNVVVLNGNKKQIITAHTSSSFGTIELKNTSSEGVVCTSLFGYEKLIKNDSKFSYEGIEGTFGYTLEADETIEEDLVLIGDTLDLNGHTLTIKGDFIHSGGIIKVNGGKLIVEGDYRQQSRKLADKEYVYSMSAGTLVMTNSNDYVCIEGDYICETYNQSSDKLSNGILEIKGDLINVQNESYNDIYTSNNHTVKLSGNRKQTVNAGGEESIRLVNVEFANTSSEGIEFKNTPAIKGNVTDNGCNKTGYISCEDVIFTNGSYKGDLKFESYDIPLSDTTIDGSVLVTGTAYLDSNVTIKGDLITDSGSIIIGGSNINVYGKCDIIFSFNDSNSYLTTYGEAILGVNYLYSGGTLEIKEDVTFKYVNTTRNSQFIFSGDSRQDVFINKDETRLSRFGKIVLNNTSKEGIYVNTAFDAYSIVNNGSMIYYGEAEGYTGDTLTEDITIDGAYALIGGYLDLNGHTMTVNGNFIHCAGALNISNGHMIVNGDYISDVITENSLNLSTGTLEIKGNIDIINAGQSVTEEKINKLLLTGSNKQAINIPAPATINTLETRNTSSEGVVILDDSLAITNLITNGNKITYEKYPEAILGFALDNDYVIDGDMVLIGGELNLNGYTLTIKGDFIHKAGKIIMSDEEAKILVEGNTFIETADECYEMAKAGTIELKGNLTLNGSAGLNTANTLKFSGEDSQKISSSQASDSEEYVSKITVKNLINENTKRTKLNTNISVTEKALDNTKTLTGNGIVEISNLEAIQAKEWNVGLKVKEDITVTEPLIIAGKLILCGDTRLNSDLKAGGIQLDKGLYINQYQLICENNLCINDTGYLVMQKSEGYVKVNSSFISRTKVNQTGLLTEGNLYVNGDFNIYYNKIFTSTENHTVTFGKKTNAFGKEVKQNISFGAGNNGQYFNRVILKKNKEEYSWENNRDIEDYAVEVLIDIDDLTPPSAVTQLIVKATAFTEIEISYDGAEDNIGIAGYEIYRDNEYIGRTTEKKYKDSNLTPGTEYTYTVYAYDEDLNLSPVSVECKASTLKDTTAPEKVMELGAKTLTGSAITLIFNKPDDNVGVAGYIIYRDNEAIATTDKNEYKDVGLKEGVEYNYSVKAYDTSGNCSEMSDAVTLSVAVPKITEVTPKDYQSLNTENVTLIVKYKNILNSTGNKVNIEYLNDKGEWQIIPKTTLAQMTYDNNTLYSSCSWDISGMSGDKEYQVRFTLTDADGNTDVREVVYNIDREAPKLPADIMATSDNGTIKLSWQASYSADCAVYEIYKRAEDEEERTLVKTIQGRLNTSFTDSDVEVNKTYAYSIKVKDECSNTSELSEETKAMVEPDKEAPVVKAITPDAGKINKNTRIRIQASDNKAVKEIILKYKEENEEEWTELATVEYNNEKAEYLWNTTELEDKVYHIGAWAVDTSGNVSTEEFTRRYEVDNTGISKIEISKHTAGSSYIQLHWNDVEDEDFSYFQIEMLENNIYKVVGKESAQLGFVVNNLKPDTEYCFRVAGYDLLGNRGEESDVYTATTSSDTIAPTIKTVLPVSSYYNDKIDLSMSISDNANVAYGVFSYSLDNKNFTQIAKVEAKGEVSEATLSYPYDITGFEEGSIYIKFEAYDKAGNKNVLTTEEDDIIVEYVIDRTPPQKVKNLMVTGGGGYASLNWKHGSDDIKYYKIYRKSDTEGEYTLINGNVTTLNYYDNGVKNQTSYSYRICAVDIAGNEGELSEPVSITIEEDKEKPKIISMSPYDGERIKDNEVIKVLVSDNAALSHVSLKYKGLSESGSLYKDLETKTITTMDGLVEFTFNTAGLNEGEYVIRAQATDLNGNISEPMDVNYVLDKTAPRKVEISVENADYMVKMSFGKSEAEDFSHYELSRKSSGKEYEIIASDIKEESYTDATVETREFYDYMLRVYDDCGNYSETEAKGIYVTDNDTIAPIAVISENLTGIAGLEIALDGGMSTDNHRIKTYEWNMGNGDRVTGRQAVYVYEEEGVYTITLKVTDENGNSDTATATVHIHDDSDSGQAFIKVADTAGNPIPYASLYVRSSNDEIMNLTSDEKGMVTIAGKYDTYTVAAMKDGYLPADIGIAISKYDTPEYTLTLKKGEVVTGNLSVRRMTMQELVDAGVDLSDPENYNRSVFTVNLIFEEKPIPVEYVLVEGKTTKIEEKTPGGNQEKPEEDKPDNGGGGREIIISSVGEEPVYVYLSQSRSISWLKDMYNVSLGVFNQADTKYVLENSKAVLNLPEGVSLAKTGKGQSLEIDMGDIEGQTQACASWVIKGDRRGTYTITADYTGTLMPFEKEIHKIFKSDAEFTVTSGDDVWLIFYPEEEAYIGDYYYIEYSVVNKSNKILYNVNVGMGSSNVTGTETIKVVNENGEIEYVEKKQEVYVVSSLEGSGKTMAPILYEGDIVYFPVLYPGGTFSGTMRIRFSNGKEGAWYETGNYYELVEFFSDKVIDNITGVRCQVIPKKGHKNARRKEYLDIPNQYGDPVDTTTGAFTEEMELLKITGGTTLGINLSYNSLNTGVMGRTGYGWTYNYASHIEENSGRIKMYFDDSSSATFVKEESLEGTVYGTVADDKIVLSAKEEDTYGTYKCVSGGMDDYTLVKDEKGYKVSAENADEYIFDKEGRLIRITDNEGKSVSLTHTERQSVVTDDISGKELIINYNEEGLITGITGAGRSASIAYTDGCISTITDENGNRRTFTYDEQHRLISGTDGNNSTYV